MRYSQGFKGSILQNVLPPASRTVAEISRETGIAAWTIYQWKRAARSGSLAEGGGEVRPRDWNPAEKLRLLIVQLFRGLVFRLVLRGVRLHAGNTHPVKGAAILMTLYQLRDFKERCDNYRDTSPDKQTSHYAACSVFGDPYRVGMLDLQKHILANILAMWYIIGEAIWRNICHRFRCI